MTVVYNPLVKLGLDKTSSSVAGIDAYKGGYDAATDTPSLDDGTPIADIKAGHVYDVTVAGTFFTALVEVGDMLTANKDNPLVEADWIITQSNLTAASIKTQYESNPDTNAYTDAELTKVGFLTVSQAVDLDTMESDITTNNAKVTNATHTGEVTGSGALTVDKIVIENKPFVTAEVGDFVLISDASDGGNLKKVDVIDFIDVFGQNFQSASSEAESSTTATTYQQKLRLNTPDLPDGTYRIGWFYEYRSNTVTRQFYGRVQINDTLTTSLIISEPKDAINYISESGMYYYVGSGITTIDLDYRISDNADLAFIRRARLEIWRVA
jgi:hypothetical protein